MLVGLIVSAVVVSAVHGARAHAQESNQGEDREDRNTHDMIKLDNEDQQGGERDNEQRGETETKESAVVNPDGKFNVTGAKVNSIDSASGSVNVTLFGFSRTVTVSGAAIMGAGRTIALGDIQPGDILGATGVFNAATRVISVSRVVDVSYAQRNTVNIQAKIQQLLQMVQALQAQLQALQGQ